MKRFSGAFKILYKMELVNRVSFLKILIIFRRHCRKTEASKCKYRDIEKRVIKTRVRVFRLWRHRDHAEWSERVHQVIRYIQWDNSDSEDRKEREWIFKMF